MNNLSFSEHSAEHTTLDNAARDVALLALRPVIVLTAEPEDVLERFLHCTLRPILKLHNASLLLLSALYAAEYRARFLQMNRAEQQTFIQSALKKDAALRNMVIGMVMGHFTDEERRVYVVHRAELHRRIVELAAKRVQDQMTQVIELCREHAM